MSVYIHQLSKWPDFKWDQDELLPVLTQVRYRQGKLLGKMESLGFKLQEEAGLNAMTMNILKSSEIEGELLDADQVRSSLARRLGIDIAGLVPADRSVEGVVEMMLDATQHYDRPLTFERLFGWHSSLFPTGWSGMHKIVVAGWRDNNVDDPMQVVSGPMGRQVVHFEAPAATLLNSEMTAFVDWFNNAQTLDPVLKAAVAHFWFVTIHPFDDGNGRIARAIADMQLSRADETPLRFYSMSAQIRKERKEYYAILEETQKGSVDITGWIEWFLQCLDRALVSTTEMLASVMAKAKFWDRHQHTALNTRQRMMINKMLDGFEGKLNTSKWAKITKSSADTALRDIQDLVSKQVLIKEPAGGRSTSYQLNL